MIDGQSFTFWENHATIHHPKKLSFLELCFYLSNFNVKWKKKKYYPFKHSNSAFIFVPKLSSLTSTSITFIFIFLFILYQLSHTSNLPCFYIFSFFFPLFYHRIYCHLLYFLLLFFYLFFDSFFICSCILS